MCSCAPAGGYRTHSGESRRINRLAVGYAGVAQGQRKDRAGRYRERDGWHGGNRGERSIFPPPTAPDSAARQHTWSTSSSTITYTPDAIVVPVLMAGFTAVVCVPPRYLTTLHMHLPAIVVRAGNHPYPPPLRLAPRVGLANRTAIRAGRSEGA
jgi:hypothetical protein